MAPSSSEMSSSSSEMSSSSSSEAPPVAPASPNKIPAAALVGDIAIAAPGSTKDGLGYIGVWAKDSAGCAALGSPAATDFAVITVSTFRNGPNALYGNLAGGLKDGKASFTLGGASGQQTVTVEQSAPDTLTVNGTALVRCVP